MLSELSIRNYALIDALSVSFEDGLNIITGETGAGKSIITGSIGFLLGAKALPDLIRSGCEEASVSAVIQVKPPNAELAAWLAERDIPCEDGELIVRRALKQNGRSSLFIQNVPVSRADLAACMGLLFDIHGQHDHESLLRPASHRVYLDRFAGLEENAAAFNGLFRDLSEKRKLLETSAVSEKERQARLDVLAYSIDEIEKAALKPGESRDLAAESAKLASFEKLAGCIENACEAFCDSQESALPLSRKAHAALSAAAALDTGLDALDSRLASLFYEAEDIAQELKNYREGLSFNPERLEQVEERLALINKLRKKYASGGGAEAEDVILAYKTEAEAEVDALSRTEENRDSLREEIAALEKAIFARAAELSAARKHAGAELSRRITVILRRLGMPAAEFTVSLSRKGAAEHNLVIGPYGADNVEFLFTANAGEEERELSRIASGGELSRVMLAIKTALVGGGEEQSAQTLIFDEIDTGIGGEVAGTVGDYLAKIGTFKQIFCVTHLAVIAAKARHHLVVEKREQNGRAVTRMRPLAGPERREEIARMLSGESSGAALAHADALLQKGGCPHEPALD